MLGFKTKKEAACHLRAMLENSSLCLGDILGPDAHTERYLPHLTGAVLSPDDRYRYLLTRVWDVKRPVLGVVMLNPSTADASIDDPTIRKVVKFAKRWGCGGISVVNVFSLRSKNPKDLCAPYVCPQGDESEKYFKQGLANVGKILVAWGRHVTYIDIHKQIKWLSSVKAEKDCLHLGLTKNGQPKHPLYIPDDKEPEMFNLEYYIDKG